MIENQQTLYSIVEGHDGSLIACGNDGANFDDYIVIKFSKPCSESLSLGEDIDATDPEGVWNLVSNASIIGTKKVKGKIIVNSGVTLTIQDATLSFSGTVPSGIIVKQGGRLIIERSRLTNLCDRPWEGIWVYGSPLIPQSLISSNHGYIQVRHNSTIENALTGVYLGNPTTSIHNGGIIRAENSFFYNNRVGIDFPAFGGAAGENISKIEHCRFDCFMALFNNPPSPDYKGTLHHVALVETHGVQILGCEFLNTGSDILYDDHFRSNGIQCINATVFVDRAGPPVLGPDDCSYNSGPKNQFYQLHKGINILDITFPVPNAPATRENILMSSNFNNCRNSIVVECDGSKKVYRNYFQYNGALSADFNGNPIYAIQMEVANNDGYVYIDSNSILYKSDYHWAPSSIGIELTNTLLYSGNCYLYRNVTQNLAAKATYFGSDQKIGFISEGENPRVFLKCNEYYDLNLDWYVKGSTTFQDQYDPANTSIYFNDFSSADGGATAWSIYSPNIAFFATGNDDDIPPSAADIPPANMATLSVLVGFSVSPQCPVTSECAVKFQFETQPGDPYVPLGPGMMVAVEPEAPEPAQEEVNQLIETLRQNQIPLCQMDEFTRSRLRDLSSATGRGARSAQGILYHCGWDLYSDTSDITQELETKANDETMPEPKLTLYPNPTSGDCQVQIFDIHAANATLRVVNVLGQDVWSCPLSPGQTSATIPAGAWTNGVYFATYVNTLGQQISVKFVVQH